MQSWFYLRPAVAAVPWRSRRPSPRESRSQSAGPPHDMKGRACPRCWTAGRVVDERGELSFARRTSSIPASQSIPLDCHESDTRGRRKRVSVCGACERLFIGKCVAPADARAPARDRTLARHEAAATPADVLRAHRLDHLASRPVSGRGLPSRARSRRAAKPRRAARALASVEATKRPGAAAIQKPCGAGRYLTCMK